MGNSLHRDFMNFGSYNSMYYIPMCRTCFYNAYSGFHIPNYQQRGVCEGKCDNPHFNVTLAYDYIDMHCR